MRKIIKIVVILIVTGLLGYMVFQISDKLKTRKELSEQIQSLPDFKFQLMDGDSFTNSDLKKNQPVVIVYFNPKCEECQYEVQQIRDNVDAFQGVELLLVTPAKKEVLLEFYKDYDLDKHPQITVLMDKNDNFHSVFGPASYPTVFIYNSSRQLVKQYRGETKVEAVLKAVRQG